MSLSTNQPSGRALMEAGLFRCLHSLCRLTIGAGTLSMFLNLFIHKLSAGLSRDPL